MKHFKNGKTFSMVKPFLWSTFTRTS